MNLEVDEFSPVALIVEDIEDRLRDRCRLFEEAGFQTLAAQTREEGYRELVSSPIVDIFVTDIDLQNNGTDKSGIDLARVASQLRRDLPRVALSGAVERLDSASQKLFDDVVLKGDFGGNVIAKRLDEWSQMARSYRRKLMDQSRERRESAQGLNVKVDMTRGFTPGHNETENDSTLLPDDVLRRMGWRLKLIDAGFEIDASPNHPVRTAGAIPFWVRQELGLYIVVLYQHPTIYSDAETEEEATVGALHLMLSCYQSFLAHPEEDQELRHLQVFLMRVFGDSTSTSQE